MVPYAVPPTSVYGDEEDGSFEVTGNPRHHDRWSGAHLLQGCRRLTSGFSFGGSSEVRVSRVDFSGPYQCCVGHAYAVCARRDVAGELRFRGDRHVDVVLRVSLACARIGHAYALH